MTNTPQHLYEFSPTFDDLDIGGIVYNANHMVYCDRARNEYFLSRGENVLDMFRRDIVFAVVACEAQYKQPLTLDRYKMLTRLVGSSDKSLSFEHAIFDKTISDDTIKALPSFDGAKGLKYAAKFTIVCVSMKKQASQPLPDAFRANITQIL